MEEKNPTPDEMAALCRRLTANSAFQAVFAEVGHLEGNVLRFVDRRGEITVKAVFRQGDVLVFEHNITDSVVGRVRIPRFLL